MAASDYRALACEVLTGVARTEEPAESRVRRGIQKHLSSLFEGVWIPKRIRAIAPGSIEST